MYAHDVVQGLTSFMLVPSGVKRSSRSSVIMTGILLMCTPLIVLWLTQAGRSVAGTVVLSRRNSRRIDLFSPLEVDYNFRMERLLDEERWCLTTMNSSSSTSTLCECEDPTRPEHRFQYGAAWIDPHHRNVRKLHHAAALLNQQQHDTPPIDVVFVGDETVQSWDGKWFNNRCPQSREIVTHWNRTFGGGTGTAGTTNNSTRLRGMALGISGDRVRVVTTQQWSFMHFASFY